MKTPWICPKTYEFVRFCQVHKDPASVKFYLKIFCHFCFSDEINTFPRLLKDDLRCSSFILVFMNKETVENSYKKEMESLCQNWRYASFESWVRCWPRQQFTLNYVKGIQITDGHNNGRGAFSIHNFAQYTATRIACEQCVQFGLFIYFFLYNIFDASFSFQITYQILKIEEDNITQITYQQNSQ